MLEAGRVGGVPGNGNIHAFMVHDGNTFLNVVRAVAVNRGAFTVRISGFFHNVQSTSRIVIIGFYIGKTVDAGNNQSRVFAKAI
ncbi:hypothetical protein SDC9_194189 [bioreactor metagenome]|uniref:Uncharacterized protein n=1 Tax=bioreactor metagenome TaxID=1076179 RepID=A0A645I5R8_9ZZZZ